VERQGIRWTLPEIDTPSELTPAPNSNEQKTHEARTWEEAGVEKIKAACRRSYVPQRREARRNRVRSDGM